MVFALLGTVVLVVVLVVAFLGDEDLVAAVWFEVVGVSSKGLVLYWEATQTVEAKARVTTPKLIRIKVRLEPLEKLVFSSTNKSSHFL